MSETCTQSCETCGLDCPSKTGASPESAPQKDGLSPLSSVKKVIAVVSGKGGVGKSLITSLLAVLLNRRGYKTAILDADITGPSIPKAFGLTKKADMTDIGLFPVVSKTGVQVMSVNLLLPNEDDPVVWRGPIISGTIRQFWSQTFWHKVDFMFIDMPPGTGDAALTVFQSMPVDGIIVVTSPQKLVSMIVGKAVKMAEMLNVPVLGMIENYSFVKCPDCGKEIQFLGESHADEVAKEHDIPLLGRLPVDPKLAAASDEGYIELFDVNDLDKTADLIESLLPPEDAPEKTPEEA